MVLKLQLVVLQQAVADVQGLDTCQGRRDLGNPLRHRLNLQCPVDIDRHHVQPGPGVWNNHAGVDDERNDLVPVDASQEAGCQLQAAAFVDPLQQHHLGTETFDVVDAGVQRAS